MVGSVETSRVTLARLVSFVEIMNRFHATTWITFSSTLDVMKTLAEGTATDPTGVLPDDRRAGISEGIGRLEKDCVAMGLNGSATSIRKIVELLAAPSTVASINRLGELARELQGRLHDEMSAAIYLSLTPSEAGLYSDSYPFGGNVIAAFPSSQYDTEEAAKCLALDRGTACVFHLMRVMESGLKALGNRLAVDTTHKPGWETILKKAHGQMTLPNDKKDPDWIKNEDSLSAAITMLTAVKTAWRNPTMHVEKTYTVEQAEGIWEAVRGFMRQLATSIHE
jgi:hypothetical protein